MSNCCTEKTSKEQYPKRHICPENGKSYLAVPYATVLHHIKKPWEVTLIDQAYYFCDDPNCDVVYFGLDNLTVKQKQLRTKVGIKESNEDAVICYCFGVTKAEAQSNAIAKTFVIEQTKNATCSCTTHNPSGRCCLKDFPK